MRGQGAQLGLVDAKQAKIEDYVTQKALDGLFLMIAEQEKAIRKDPVGAATRGVTGSISAHALNSAATSTIGNGDANHLRHSLHPRLFAHGQIITFAIGNRVAA